VLLQVEQELEAVRLLADHGALASHIVIKAKDPVAPHRLGEALDLDRRLLLGRHLIFGPTIICQWHDLTAVRQYT